MNRLKPLFALIFVFVMTGALPGCATERTCGAGCSGDAKITTNVQALIDQHPDLGPPNSINVQTLDHVVYLNGLVSTGLQREIAESVARETTGVVKVENLIAVTH
jgi:osmotically-inducible protein OsmY